MNQKEIKKTVSAFQKSRILLTAYELDIFTFIGHEKHNSESISKALSLNKNATEKLLNALVAFGFLEKENNKFSNTDESYNLLSKNSSQYMSGLMHSNHLWNTWNKLTEIIKTGEASHTEEINSRGKEWLEAFINAMHYRGKIQAPSQIYRIDLENVDKILDIGGGSGCYSMEFINRKNSIKATVYDLPNVTPISKKIIKKEGYTNNISIYEGDYTTDNLPKGFDLIFLSAVIHSNSYETNKNLVEKCYNSLNPNGKIIIQDWIMNESKTEPLQGAVFSINMLVGVKEGDCFSENEVTEWLKNAGCKNIFRNRLEAGLSQMIGVKC